MKEKRIWTAVCTAFMAVALSGCAALNSKAVELKGDLSGNEFMIDTFDNYGTRTMQTHGRKVNISPNIVEEESYDTETGGWIESETESSVLTITIDGKEMETCGDTTIFYDTRLVPDYDFYQNRIESSDDGKITANPFIAEPLNKLKNLFGKSRVVIIKSQLGQPIYAFSGDNVYWEVAEGLPKFTKILVDGKPLYIHRANFQIIDKKLIS